MHRPHCKCRDAYPSGPRWSLTGRVPRAQDFVEGISEVQSKKKSSLNYYS
jgi:hypothetical protein